MATLNEVMKDTADAIREKTGKSELIAPVDFASEIKGITAGGGDAPSGGESNIEYLDVSGLGETNESLRNGLVMFADIVKSKNEEGTFVGVCLTGIQMLFGISTNNTTTCVAVAVDLTRHIMYKLINGEGAVSITIAQVLTSLVEGITQADIDSIPRLTKEQFYTLE
jgi:hypothetical protein